MHYGMIFGEKQSQHPNVYEHYKPACKSHSMVGESFIRYEPHIYLIFEALKFFFPTASLIFTAMKLFHQVI